MTATHFRLMKRPAPPEIIHQAVRQEVYKAMGAVGRLAVAEREKIVSNFKTPIRFKYRVRSIEKQIELIVSVANPDEKLERSDWTVADLWDALDRTGTRPHVIRPKRARVLRFQWGGPGSYKPKTRPRRGGGPGVVTGGKTVFRKQVKHPGFKPRHFTERINKELAAFADRQILGGLRRGARKIPKR